MSILSKIMGYFSNTEKEKEEIREEAASYANSPQIYEIEMFQVATDRMNVIQDVNLLCSENGDIRFQRANQIAAADATAGGFNVIVQGSEKDKARKKKQGKAFSYSSPGTNRAQQVIDDFMKRTKLSRLSTQHAAALLREGDLFLNVLVDLPNGLVTQIRRAPALSIKKNVDEYGEFFDPLKAYSQFDTLNPTALQFLKPPESSRRDFAIYQMNHIRWMPDENKIYGCSQYAVARKSHRMLEEMEKAMAYRRMYRSVSKRAHKLPEDADEADILRYKRENAMIDANGNPTKNTHLLSDFVGNVDVVALHDVANLDEVADIEQMKNDIWISLLVPEALITGGQNINRDILKVQYPKYLKSLASITETLEYGDSQMYSGYRDIIDLQLMLAGINPATVQYDIVWNTEDNETPMERMERVQAALGKNGGRQIITMEKAVQIIADDFDIEDPTVTVEQILAESAAKQEQPPTPAPPQDGAQQVLLKDEYIDDFDQMDELAESLQLQVSSFFYDVAENTVKKATGIMTDDIEDFSIEEILALFESTWDEKESELTTNYIAVLAEAAELGNRRAEQLLKTAYRKKGIKLSRSIRIETDDIIEWLQDESGKRIRAIKDTTRKQIRQCLSDGFRANKGWKELKVDLLEVIASPVRVEMIARTEISFAYSEHNIKVYENSGVQMVEWMVTDDLRCCDACRERNGQIYSIKNRPSLPMHPRCRCCWLPVI